MYTSPLSAVFGEGQSLHHVLITPPGSGPCFPQPSLLCTSWDKEGEAQRQQVMEISEQEEKPGSRSPAQAAVTAQGRVWREETGYPEGTSSPLHTGHGSPACGRDPTGPSTSACRGQFPF